MRHFTLEDWADFARQTTAADRRASMQCHLDEGCSSCLKVLDIWRNVCSVAGEEFFYQPPEGAVRVVKLAFRNAATVPPGKMSIGRLIFDSFRQPAPAGVRNSMRSTRQALYRAGQFLIDMRLDSEPESNCLSLAGQVLDTAPPRRGINASPIFLLREKKLLARTVTNEFGEFHFDFEGSNRLRLLIEIEGKKPIAVSLGGLEKLPTNAQGK